MTTFSQTQLATLNAITNNNTANFWEGYTYVKSIVSNSGGASDLLFWLDQAAQINADQYESQGNFFIRDVTRAGFIFSGVSTFDLQKNSNTIAQSVIGDILASGEVPSLDGLILQDVSTAVNAGNETVAGWGGAFYYWNHEFSEGKTVGDKILSDAIEYDKFVAIVAKAASDAIGKFGVTWAEISAGWGSEVPLSTMSVIGARIVDVQTGAVPSFAGDPDDIDGYKPVFDSNHAVIGWVLSIPGEGDIPQTDATLIAQLNQRRQYRVDLAHSSAFAAPNPDAGLHNQAALDAMLRDSTILNSLLTNSPNSFVASTLGQADLGKLAAWYAGRLSTIEAPKGDEQVTFGILGQGCAVSRSVAIQTRSRCGHWPYR